MAIFSMFDGSRGQSVAIQIDENLASLVIFRPVAGPAVLYGRQRLELKPPDF
jgi:hypothetical protein